MKNAMWYEERCPTPPNEYSPESREQDKAKNQIAPNTYPLEDRYTRDRDEHEGDYDWFNFYDNIGTYKYPTSLDIPKK